MTTFSKSLLPMSADRLKKRTKVPVAIRVRHHNKVGYISTGVEIGCVTQGGLMQPNWYDGMITPREPEWLAKNQEVERILQSLEHRCACLVNPGMLSCDELCTLLRNEDIREETYTMTLQDVAEEYLQQKRGTVSEGYRQMVAHSLDRFCSWIGGRVLPSHVTSEALSAYRAMLEKQTKTVEIKEAYFSTQYKQTRYRRTTRVEKALSTASINKELSHIKAVVNFAIDEGLVKYDRHPFARVEIPRSCAKETDVEPEVIQRLRDANLSTENHLLARDVFMLSFYLGGMNYRDILNADFSTDTVVYCREKTKNATKVRRSVKVPVLPEAREILDRRTKNGRWHSGLNYTQPRDEISYIGKHLREVVALLGLPSYMTFYSARKSFSQYALDMGINDVVTDYLLGHSDSHRGVISYYSRVTTRMAGLALRRVIDYMNDPDRFTAEIERAILG